MRLAPKNIPHPLILPVRPGSIRNNRWVRLVVAGLSLAIILCAVSTQAVPPPDNDPAWAHAVNLLPLIDPVRDAVVGTWLLEKGKLVAAGDKNALQIPWVPPDEYDFRIVFSRTRGDENIGQIFSQAGRPAAWIMDGWQKKIFALQLVDGKDAFDNKTTVHAAHGFENGHIYTSVLEVRKDGVQALVDGKLMTKWATDFSNAGANDILKLPDPRLLGLAPRCPAIFYKVDVVEKSGRGKALYAIPPSGPPALERTPPLAPPMAMNATVAGRGAKGKFYVDVDDAVRLYINGNEVFHVSEPSTVESTEIEIKPGDRLVAQLRNVKEGRHFMMIFASTDRRQLVSFPHNVFKILPDPDAQDFAAADLAKISKYSKIDARRHEKPLPFRNRSEWIWGEADFCALGCEVTAEMFAPFPR